jgi:hypothetical protein
MVARHGLFQTTPCSFKTKPHINLLASPTINVSQKEKKKRTGFSCTRRMIQCSMLLALTLPTRKEATEGLFGCSGLVRNLFSPSGKARV